MFCSTPPAGACCQHSVNVFSCFYYVATHLSIPLWFRTLDNMHSSRNFRQCTSPKRGVSDARLRMCLNIIFLKVVDFGPAAPSPCAERGTFLHTKFAEEVI